MSDGLCSEYNTGQEANNAEKEDMPVEEYVSKTLGAKIYQRPPQDPNIVVVNTGDHLAPMDSETGDMLIPQVVDRERGIRYYAYVTKDRDLVRVFMTKFGEPGSGKRWKVFPIRVWHIEDVPNLTPAAEAALPRATIERFAQLMSSWPRFNEDSKFMIIDAPVSEVDPL